MTVGEMLIRLKNEDHTQEIGVMLNMPGGMTYPRAIHVNVPLNQSGVPVCFFLMDAISKEPAIPI